MAYLALDKITEARSYVEENIKKPDTFMGLVLFLVCVVERKRNGSYLKSDMKRFSEFADDAFYLSETRSSYSDKYWFALLTNDWVDQVKDYFLKGNKVSANKIMQSLFWLDSFSELQLKTNLIPNDIFDALFIDDINESDFNQTSQVRKADFLASYGGNQEALTIKFDGSFVKKKAGDLSGAPFGQTLYAATEIKKIISVFDFDFIEKFDLTGTNKTYNYHAPSSEVCLSKPFLLLAGISGTGKTRFVREQAKESGSLDETYCLVPVRPDWHEPSDLLGYVSRLGQQPQYIATDVLRFIVRAWKGIIKSIDFDTNGKAIDWTGRDLQDIPPYWLCLDEMNLAPVEQYFADYLSILETRCWNDPDALANSGRDYIYQCDPLLSADVFSDLDNNFGEYHGSEKINVKPSTLLAQDLGLDLTKPLEKDIWSYFLEHGISIPFNLIIAGTVNMDETTHGFSRKVIDRALSFDFGEFFPNDFTEFFAKKYQNKKLSYPIFSHISQDDLASTFDVDGSKTVTFLSAVNAVLKHTPFELAFRALNELLLAVASSQPQDDLTLQAVWDDFIMCKVLPRIEGDEDKLMGSPPSDDNILQRLKDILAQQLADIWNTDRPHLYREGIEHPDDKVMVACRSKKKLDWMNDQLIRGFVSFWP